MKGPGKLFEDDIKASVPEDWMFIRMQDGGGWSNAENTRFTISNFCDFVLFNGRTLFLIECKSVLGGTLPIKNINLKSLEKMYIYQFEKKNVVSTFIVNFRGKEKTYAINVNHIRNLLALGYKSISEQDCINNGLEIPGRKKIKRFAYTLDQFDI